MVILVLCALLVHYSQYFHESCLLSQDHIVKGGRAFSSYYFVLIKSFIFIFLQVFFEVQLTNSIMFPSGTLHSYSIWYKITVIVSLVTICHHESYCNIMDCIFFCDYICVCVCMCVCVCVCVCCILHPCGLFIL